MSDPHSPPPTVEHSPPPVVDTVYVHAEACPHVNGNGCTCTPQIHRVARGRS